MVRIAPWWVCHFVGEHISLFSSRQLPSRPAPPFSE
jgi:hypothetical protein